MGTKLKPGDWVQFTDEVLKHTSPSELKRFGINLTNSYLLIRLSENEKTAYIRNDHGTESVLMSVFLRPADITPMTPEERIQFVKSLLGVESDEDLKKALT